jgi:small subunit ribosomal protein S6
LYEATLIIKPDVQEEDAQKTEGNVKSIITEGGGSVSESSLSPKQRLAYKVDKFDEGYQLKINFEFPPDKMDELDRSFSRNQNLLRHLILRK